MLNDRKSVKIYKSELRTIIQQLIHDSVQRSYAMGIADQWINLLQITVQVNIEYINGDVFYHLYNDGLKLRTIRNNQNDVLIYLYGIYGIMP